MHAVIKCVFLFNLQYREPTPSDSEDDNEFTKIPIRRRRSNRKPTLAEMEFIEPGEVAVVPEKTQVCTQDNLKAQLFIFYFLQTIVNLAFQLFPTD